MLRRCAPRHDGAESATSPYRLTRKISATATPIAITVHRSAAALITLASRPPNARLKRLYEAIESGVADLADESLKERIEELRSLKTQAQADAERALSALDGIGAAITPAKLRWFAAAARRRLRGPTGGYRRDNLRALAQRVEVADREVRITGSTRTCYEPWPSQAKGNRRLPV